MDTLLVTGGAGFIGSNFVRLALAAGGDDPPVVVVFDKLTYAGNLASLAEVAGHPRFAFVHGDIADRAAVAAAFREHRPTAVVNFAAESHVDRSIDDASDFVRTNIVGAFELLEAARRHLKGAAPDERERFRFLQVSTDEVYGSLGPDRPLLGRVHLRPQLPLRRLQGRPPTTWCGPTARPTGCRRSSPTARTTSAPTSSRRSWCR